jgi:metal-responsive CopG/Arc/MetJ family transcriptional regulator
MKVNLTLDSELVDRVFKITGASTRCAAVTTAIEEFIARREQRNVIELFGKFEWDNSFDCKSERTRS